MQNSIHFDALKISLASPDEIRSWSYGEVTRAETINYRTLKPEKGGLFDERIFGPTKDFECYCGKYKRQRYKGVVCEKCGVEVTHSRVRRERMGHIELAAPVVHTWYFRRNPNKLPNILDIGLRDLESVIYFAQFLVTDVDAERRQAVIDKIQADLDLKKKELETETNEKIETLKKTTEDKVLKLQNGSKVAESTELQIENLNKDNRRETLYLREELIDNQNKLDESFKEVITLIESIEVKRVVSEAEMGQLDFWEATDFFKAGMGAEAITEVLAKVDLHGEIEKLNKIIDGKSKAKRLKAIKRLKIIQGLIDSRVNPSWAILTVLPVIPPDLRPIVQLPGGRFATSDLNDLYRRVINRNNRLRDLIQLGAPEIILQNEKRMLQEALDSLIEGSRRVMRGRKELQSLTDMLKGKQGRFRQNLLGKRVDYSGRSVIVVGPNLRIDQVGVPKEMALELFKPFVLRDLILEGYAPNLKSAKNVLEDRSDEVWDILERVTRDHPVILNRAPTLHRQNIQAFYPVLIGGKAISFHPSVAGSFAADFDGDQMAIHVPLSAEAAQEAKDLLLSPHNVLKLSSGQPVFDLKNELSLGLYYLTIMDESKKADAIRFIHTSQVLSAYQNNKISLHTPIECKINEEPLITTAGRIIFNQLLPKNINYVNERVNRNVMRNLIANCFNEHGENETAYLIDRFKEAAQYYVTKAGISYSMFDFSISDKRDGVISEAHDKVDEIEQNYQMGLLTTTERHNQIIGVWEEATNRIADIVAQQIDPESIIGWILESKSYKSNPETIRQIQGIRGLMVDSQGLVKETPIISTFLEGQTSFEGFLNMVGGRKSLIDVALLTASAGYLTRRLVDATHDLIIREQDCGTEQGVYVREESGVEDWSLASRIEGRTAWKDIKTGKKVIVHAGELITAEQARAIVAADINEVGIRSLLTCETSFGVCSKCYGQDMGTRRLVETGVKVGVIAAQSIGEPGTQLTLHSKHRAGVAKKEITQGLPRIEELFETRTPKHSALLSEVSGTVTEIQEKDDEVIVVIEGTNKEERHYSVPNPRDLKVSVGDTVEAGDTLTEGHIDLEEILELKGVLAAQKYLMKEIQSVYKSQGVTINDKHVELIIRKMSEKVRVKTSGDSSLLPGDYASIHRFNEINQTLDAAGKELAKGNRVILGISRAAILTESWLSAASFEETANVLAAASINERPNVDNLYGLKENVIIGRLLPTGSEDQSKTHKFAKP